MMVLNELLFNYNLIGNVVINLKSQLLTCCVNDGCVVFSGITPHGSRREVFFNQFENSF